MLTANGGEPAAFSAAGADELLAERTGPASGAKEFEFIAWLVMRDESTRTQAWPGELLLLVFWRACRVDTGWAGMTHSTRFEGELVNLKRKISS